MNRRLLMRALFAAGAGSLFSSLRASRAIEEPEFTLHSNVRLVVLDVGVKDKKGRFVSDLAKDNFTVLENGKPQQITVFAHDDLPVTAGVLVDESLSMKPKRAVVLEAAEDFIRQSNPHDEIFVLNFNDKVRRGLPKQTLFSSKPEQLRAALERGLPEGKTALYDAVVEGIQQLRRGRYEKKALVLISDGGDNASSHTRREVQSLVQESPAVIYTIGIYDEDDPDRDPALLRQLASISGGEAYFPERTQEMIGICQRIATDLRVRYTVGYIPRAGNSSLRRIRVRVAGRDGVTVLARNTYRYDGIPGQTNE